MLCDERRAPINRALRRSYDLRGVAGRDLTPTDARAVGLAFSALARRRGRSRVAVSRDGRLSSPELAAALIDGLCSGGMHVFRLPVGPTPLVSFAIDRLALHGGLMVTGSHNPADQNGFKLLLDGKPLYGEALGALWEVELSEPGGGTVTDIDPTEEYLAALGATLPPLPPLSVAWDSGNGATGPIVDRLVRQIPGRHVPLHTRIDGRFPNHHPDPSVPANLRDLSMAVRRENCDLGFAFDGDGDRLGVVDESGTIVWPDQILLLLARDVLRDRPASPVVADVKSSATLFEGIAAAGGRPLMGPSGYVKVRERMIRENAPLAGEMSGHIFFADRWHGSDDGLYAAMRVLRALMRSGRSLRAFREGLPPVVATPEIRLACPDAEKTRVIEEIAGDCGKSGAAVDRTDGIRVTDDRGWWLIRGSGTEAKLTVRCEARDEISLGRLKRDLAARLRLAGLDASGLDEA